MHSEMPGSCAGLANSKQPLTVVFQHFRKRTIQTASSIEAPQERWKALNEIDAVHFA